jgi:hypothetical protein
MTKTIEERLRALDSPAIGVDIADCGVENHVPK